MIYMMRAIFISENLLVDNLTVKETKKPGFHSFMCFFFFFVVVVFSLFFIILVFLRATFNRFYVNGKNEQYMYIKSK